jgi:S1-C subfamily serine protease
MKAWVPVVYHCCIGCQSRCAIDNFQAPTLFNLLTPTKGCRLASKTVRGFMYYAKQLKTCILAATIMLIATTEVYSQKVTFSPQVDYDSSSETSIMPVTSVITGLGDDNLTFVTVRYATTLFKAWIALASNTYLTTDKSGAKLQILDWGIITDDEDDRFSSLYFDEQYSIKRRTEYNIFMVFPSIPETAKTLSIREPGENGFYWRGIHINNENTENWSQGGSSSYSEKGEFTPSGSGTGFAISADGYVATCHHVVANARAIRIKGINGNFENAHVARVVAKDEDRDLAILKVDGVTIPRVPYIISANSSDVGEEVFVLGYPQTQHLGEELKLTTGVISSRSGFRGDVTTYQISAQVLPGNSGCPLFDNDGRVIGVVNAKYIEPNVSYAVKLSYLKLLIDRTHISLRQPVGNDFAGKTLAEKVKAVRNYIYIIEVQ